MATFDQFIQDIPLLFESGMIAVKQGDEESAKKLFGAIAVIDPSHTGVKMGQGLIALHKMETRTAIAQFQEVVKSSPEDWRAKAFLAFAYMVSTLKEETTDKKMEGLTKAAEISQDVVDNCDAADTVRLAQSILDWEDELQQKQEQKGPLG